MASGLSVCRIYRAFRNFAFILIFGAIFSLLGTTYACGEDAPIFYTVKLNFIRDDIALHIKEGDIVTDGISGENIGTVTKVDYAQALSENYSSEKNEMVISECEGYSDVYITVKAEAKRKNSVLQIGSYTLNRGKTMFLHLPDFAGEGICVSTGGK